MLYLLEILVKVIKKEKEVRGNDWEGNVVNNVLFVDDVVIYIEKLI